MQKKKEIKVVGAILEGVANNFMEDKNVVESLIRNLHVLMSHACADKYADEYGLAKSLLALTKHRSPDVVGCAWKVLALNMHGWASEFSQKIEANLSGEDLSVLQLQTLVIGVYICTTVVEKCSLMCLIMYGKNLQIRFYLQGES